MKIDLVHYYITSSPKFSGEILHGPYSDNFSKDYLVEWNKRYGTTIPRYRHKLTEDKDTYYKTDPDSIGRRAYFRRYVHRHDILGNAADEEVI